MKKIVNVALDKEKFEKWLEENNKVKNKRAVIEYLAENGNEEAKETLKQIKSGELDAEKIEMRVEKDMDEFEKNITDRNIDGMKLLYKAIVLIGDENPEEFKEELEAFDEDTLRAMYFAIISSKSEEILDLIETFGKLIKVARFTNAFMKAKNDMDC